MSDNAWRRIGFQPIVSTNANSFYTTDFEEKDSRGPVIHNNVSSDK